MDFSQVKTYPASSPNSHHLQDHGGPTIAFSLSDTNGSVANSVMSVALSVVAGVVLWLGLLIYLRGPRTLKIDSERKNGMLEILANTVERGVEEQRRRWQRKHKKVQKKPQINQQQQPQRNTKQQQQTQKIIKEPQQTQRQGQQTQRNTNQQQTMKTMDPAPKLGDIPHRISQAIPRIPNRNQNIPKIPHDILGLPNRRPNQDRGYLNMRAAKPIIPNPERWNSNLEGMKARPSDPRPHSLPGRFVEFQEGENGGDLMYNFEIPLRHSDFLPARQKRPPNNRHSVENRRRGSILKQRGSDTFLSNFEAPLENGEIRAEIKDAGKYVDGGVISEMGNPLHVIRESSHGIRRVAEMRTPMRAPMHERIRFPIKMHNEEAIIRTPQSQEIEIIRDPAFGIRNQMNEQEQREIIIDDVSPKQTEFHPNLITLLNPRPNIWRGSGINQMPSDTRPDIWNSLRERLGTKFEVEVSKTENIQTANRAEGKLGIKIEREHLDNTTKKKNNVGSRREHLEQYNKDLENGSQIVVVQEEKITHDQEQDDNYLGFRREHTDEYEDLEHFGEYEVKFEVNNSAKKIKDTLISKGVTPGHSVTSHITYPPTQTPSSFLTGLDDAIPINWMPGD